MELLDDDFYWIDLMGLADVSLGLGLMEQMELLEQNKWSRAEDDLYWIEEGLDCHLHGYKWNSIALKLTTRRFKGCLQRRR